MKSKSTKPCHEQIVYDFDEYLMKNIPRLLDEDSITIIKEISHEWRELRINYINYLLSQFKNIKLRHLPHR